MPEEDAEYVIQAMAKAKAGDRRVVVDWADKTPTDIPHGKPRRERQEKPQQRQEKPHREQRGKGKAFTKKDKREEDKFYAKLAPKQKEPRQKKEKKYSKDDWKQFFKK